MAFPLVDEIFIELQRAVTKKKHGFKTFVFRSGNSIRTVVLRKVNRVDKTLWIFTDKRTQKIIEIAKDGKVGCLFWDGKIGYQLRIKANATVHLERRKAERSVLACSRPIS